MGRGTGIRRCGSLALAAGTALGLCVSALPARSLTFGGAVSDTAALERDDWGRVVRISGQLEPGGVVPPPPLADAVPITGTFTLESDGSGDVRARPGTVSIEVPLGGALFGSLTATALAPMGPLPRDPATSAPLVLPPSAAAPSRAAFDALQTELATDPNQLQRMVCATSIGFSDPAMADRCRALAATPAPRSIPNLSLASLGADPAALTPAQQAVLGCGETFGTSCSEDVDIFHTVAGALLDRFPGFSPPELDGLSNACLATLNGGAFVLPGCDAPTDGGVGGTPGDVVTDGLSALSWNLMISLAALSGASGDELPGSTSGDGCSFLNPAGCSALANLFLVRALLALAAEPLPDDPFEGPLVRWLWETGGVYRVTGGTGPLGGIVGGTLFVFGPFADPEGGAGRVGFLLTPAAVPEPATALLVAGSLAALAGLRRLR